MGDRSVHTTEDKILYTDRLRLVIKMFMTWQKQAQFNSFNITG